ncbi:serine/threonine protein kinase [Catenulispora acidiphila DSM 44928]|uniref:Serine/threonine protein kinase n=1 Tax=Catenulispora acidiphila (strain DSM 44928 / JCM 14897 / NBRC 102108 / NRRL B-24433 / ID139908) TaxID=479433 RepID=C7Q6Y8_CATAD|nr:class III lanthionine synthetase LanKC [Catenulispora acidiphila]ACU76001.1 serine/threonine protein kinase [Catenulispora acidiphila DSM 44928]
MRRFDSYVSAAKADPRFYDTLARLETDDDLAARMAAGIGPDFSVTIKDIWAVAVAHSEQLPEMPDHGWKIHVSARADQAAAALDAVCALFQAKPFNFKCLRDMRFVRMSSARWWTPGQVGKVLAIYPRTAEECRDLLAELTPLLKDIRGPYVLTDRRHEGSQALFYRYGEFRALGRRSPDGDRIPIVKGPDGQTWRDERGPVYRRPPWVDELFPQDETEGKQQSHTLHGYRVIRPLHYSGTGGVYLAERVSDGVQVVLKEARAETGFSEAGTQAQDRLRREFDALTRLKGSGVAPEPIELFEEWEHLFLVEEFIDGLALISFIGANHPLTRNIDDPDTVERYRSVIAATVSGLRRAVEACHNVGLTYGDLSLTNIIVDPETHQVRLIDFESVRPVDVDQEGYPHTAGFAPAETAGIHDGRIIDGYGIDATELAMLMPRPTFRDLDAAALARSAHFLAAGLDYPVEDLLDRLELAADTALEDLPGPADLAAQAMRFATAVMTPERDDRLFPADPLVMATNPWSVGYGAAGVVRALHRITGEVPEPVRDWMRRSAPSLAKIPPGLYTGRAGVAWTLHDIGETEWSREILDTAVADAASWPDMPASILSGWAGIGTACLALGSVAGGERFLEHAERIGSDLATSGQDDGQGLHWPVAGQNFRSVGYDRGSAGIATFLLSLFCVTGDKRYLRIGRRALEYDLAQAIEHDEVMLSFPQRVGGGTSTPYWSRGAAGMGTALIRFCRVTGDPRLRAVLDQLMRSRVAGISVSPALFNGMAGMANVALDYAELLDAPEYRQNASRICGAIRSLASLQPEGVAFPGESLVRFSTDYATGSAGIALVLDRLERTSGDFNFTVDHLLDGHRA